MVVALGVAAAGVTVAVLSILLTASGLGGDRSFRLQSASMEPTYRPGDVVTVQDAEGQTVRRGDVVVFSAHDWGDDQVFMQRVIGVGGDRVVVGPTGTVTVNGTPLDEPYLAGDSHPGVPVDVTVPAGRLFLLGDHRNDAIDSRFHLDERRGSIARAAVVGVVVPHPATSSPNRLWTWVGASLAVAGLAAAAVAAAVRRRRTAPAPPYGPV